MVAANLANMRQGARTDIQHKANLPEVSNQDAADKLSVSERSVKSAKQVKEKGIPELVEVVEQGERTDLTVERSGQLQIPRQTASHYRKLAPLDSVS